MGHMVQIRIATLPQVCENRLFTFFDLINNLKSSKIFLKNKQQKNPEIFKITN